MGSIRTGAEPELRTTKSNPFCLTPDEVKLRFAPWWGPKFSRYIPAGYEPHNMQSLAHSSDKRFVFWGAGRRSGKTYGGAYDAASNADPSPLPIYQLDDTGAPVLGADGQPIIERWSTVQRECLRMRGVNLPPESHVIVGAIVVPSVASFPATIRDFLTALRTLGIKFQYNKQDKTIGLPSLEPDECQSLVYLKGCDQPDRLAGDGYCWSWWDEPGSVKGRDAWDTFEGSLTQKRGCCNFTGTPGRADANWWVYDIFLDPNQNPRLDAEGSPVMEGGKPVYDGRTDVEVVTWYSVENPEFPRDEYYRLKKSTPAPIFQREFEAKWIKSNGRVLDLDYLERNYYKREDIKLKDGLPDQEFYRIYVGVDPAPGGKAHNDFFVACVVLVAKESGMIYVWEFRAGHWDTTQQLKELNKIELIYQPDLFAIESNAYQVMVAEQFARLETMPNVIEVLARGKKEDRLEAMGISFETGRIRVREDQTDFVREWIEFPNGRHDDHLDSCEIALRVARGHAKEIALNDTEDLDSHQVSSGRRVFPLRQLANNHVDPALGSLI